MMWLHPLQSMHKKPSSRKIHNASWCHDGPSNFVPGPKSMPHPTFRGLRICSIGTRPIVACHKGWSQLGDFEIYQTIGIHNRFDRELISILRERDRNVVGKE
jgi:hypothetical protein